MRPAFRLLLAVALLSAPVAGAAQAVETPARRTAAEERVRARFTRLLRERVGLSDDQLRRLTPVTRTFQDRRQGLLREERSTRQALRRELSATSPDQARVAAQIDQLLALQRRRLDLAVEEQRALAAFMTPVQRARYLALQEHLRRRTNDMGRRRRGDGPGRNGGPRGVSGRVPTF